MIILGIDPGLATTGIGLIEKQGNKHRLIDYGIISTPAKLDLPERLMIIAQELTSLLKATKPDNVAVESLFFNTNVKTAFMVAQARGVILLTAKQAGIPITSYTPPQIKLAVSGYGKATKAQVQYMVQKLLNLSKKPTPDDAADALAIAICHSHSQKMQSLKP